MEPKPLFDTTKAEDLCGVEEGEHLRADREKNLGSGMLILAQLSILSLERLKAMQEEIAQTSAQASALLAWNLQYKDAQAQDSAT